MSSQIICPRCQRILNKPPALEMLGEIQQGGGGFIGFGDPNDHLSCPSCGFKLRIGDIIDGKFDPKKPESSVLGTVVGYLVLIIIVAGIVAMCSRCG